MDESEQTYVPPDPSLDMVEDDPDPRLGPDDLDGCTLVEDTEAEAAASLEEEGAPGRALSRSSDAPSLEFEPDPVELTEDEHAAR